MGSKAPDHQNCNLRGPGVISSFLVSLVDLVTSTLSDCLRKARYIIPWHLDLESRRFGASNIMAR